MAGRVLIPTVSSRAARHMARSFTGAMPINYRGYEADDDTLATMSRSSMTRTGTGGSLTDPILAGSFSSVHYDSIYDSSEFSGQRNSIEVMRKRLKSHFMTPYQKYKHRGRKPWKLLLQLLKLLMVTVQIFLFASELFAVVDFLDDSKQAFSYLLNGNDGADYAIYTKDQFYSQVRFSLKQYYHLQDIAVGTFGLPQNKDHTIKPMNICIYKYNDSHVDPENETYYINRQTTYSCRDLFPPNASDANMTAFITRNNLPLTFDSIISVMLMVDVRSLHVRKPPSRPACYKFNITIQFDNSNHDGQVPVTLEAKGEILNCSRYSTDVGDGMHDYQAMKTFRVFFDIFTILVCAASMCLCFRSIKRHMQLVKATRNFFNRELHDHLSYWDCLDLMNLWFILIVISDISAIVGSLLKMIINIRVTKADQLYSVCSMFLGTAVLLTWSGLLRYLGYLKKYNILLVTLKASAPSVLRFCVCGALLYFGYLFCGWIVLGPYHVKFRSLVTVSECMFSLINGDDMFPTFAEMGTRSYAVWVFSKFYLYTFISLFIYIVLSLFIGIISDTYERIKDWGHPPCTKLQRFVHGNTCQRCATECTDDMLDNGVGVGNYCADP